MERITGTRVNTESIRSAMDTIGESIASPDIVERYKQLWSFISVRDGVTFAEISKAFGWGYGQTRCMVDGASLYPGSKLYEDLAKSPHGRKVVLKWDKEE